MKSIYCLDDDVNILQVLQIWLTGVGYKVGVFSSSEDLMSAMKRSTPDMILLDVRLKEEKNGTVICSDLRKQCRYTLPIYLFSATPMQKEALLQIGADGFIDKPFDLYVLENIIHRAISNKKSCRV